MMFATEVYKDLSDTRDYMTAQEASKAKGLLMAHSQVYDVSILSNEENRYFIQVYFTDPIMSWATLCSLEAVYTVMLDLS